VRLKTIPGDRFTTGWYLGHLFGMVGFLLLVVLILEVLRQARELVARRGSSTHCPAMKLQELGWAYGQGWLFGKPNPIPQPNAAA